MLESMKQELMKEAYKSRFARHPSRTKMYRDLKKSYSWENMKNDIVVFVSYCLSCQQVKAEHKKAPGTLHDISLLEWK